MYRTWSGESRRRMKEDLDDTIYKGILDTAESVKIDTKPYKGKTVKTEVTHPSYTLKERY
jgi:hypothetical protein